MRDRDDRAARRRAARPRPPRASRGRGGWWARRGAAAPRPRRPSPPCAPARARRGSAGPSGRCTAAVSSAKAPSSVRAAPSSSAAWARSQSTTRSSAGSGDRRLGQHAHRAGELDRPAAGTSTPESTSSSVVLPAPLGPVTATRSPRCSVRSTSAQRRASARRAARRCAGARARARAGAAAAPGARAGGDHRLALELAPQPALARLRLPGHLLGVALELGRGRAADRALGVLRLAARHRDVGLEASSSLLLRLVGQCELRPPALALGAMIAVAALVAGQHAAGLELEDAADDRVEERAVVRDDDHGPREAAQPVLEPLQAVAVEVVGRLVEEQHGRAPPAACRPAVRAPARRPTAAPAACPRRGGRWPARGAPRRATPPAPSRRAPRSAPARAP